MRHALRFIIRLYPANWRDRYGNEFAALLDDAGPSWRNLLDVLKGALEMQMTTWSFGKIAIVFAVVGIVLSGGISLAIPDTYASTAVLQVRLADPAQPDKMALSRSVNTIAQTILSRDSLREVIEREGLYERDRASKGMDEAVEKMRQNIRISNVVSPPSRKDLNAFTISFSGHDAAQTQRITKTIVNGFLSAKEKSGIEALEVLDPAGLPKMPYSPIRSRIVGVGLIAGLLLGVVTAKIRRHPAPSA
jgi:uncharacterized protein involved in exopolysaccharide biosynthesis